MQSFQVVDRKVTLTLVGLDGNAWSLMGAFQKQARREGWTQDEITLVLNKCQEGDYNALLCTLMAHCEEEDADLEDGEEYEYENDDDDDEEEA